jgi:hypothetical protein
MDSALNTAFSDWGNILYKTIIATAIAVLLVENPEVFLLAGESFRKAGKNPHPPVESFRRLRACAALWRYPGPRSRMNNPSTALPIKWVLSGPCFLVPSIFNFSANHLFLISRTEYASCAVLIMLDHDTRRVYRLFDFTKGLRLTPVCAYCVAGKVNSINTVYLMIESVKLDTKHGRSTTRVPADGAGGLVNLVSS